MTNFITSGFVNNNRNSTYYEIYGTGDVPIVLVHGGFGLVSTFEPLIHTLTADRRVIAVELRGHGHSPDNKNPFSYQEFGDDIAAVISQLTTNQADLLGYSLGGGVAIRCAIQHPELVRKLVVVSAPCASEGWLGEVRTGMKQANSSNFELMKQSPMYKEYASVAPDIDAFPDLMDKTSELVSSSYDWSNEISKITAPTLLACGDMDSVTIEHIAHFYKLLGGNQKDAGWDNANKIKSQVAVLSDTTHYDIITSPRLTESITNFLD